MERQHRPLETDAGRRLRSRSAPTGQRTVPTSLASDLDRYAALGSAGSKISIAKRGSFATDCSMGPSDRDSRSRVPASSSASASSGLQSIGEERKYSEGSSARQAEGSVGSRRDRHEVRVRASGSGRQRGRTAAPAMPRRVLHRPTAARRRGIRVDPPCAGARGRATAPSPTARRADDGAAVRPLSDRVRSPTGPSCPTEPSWIDRAETKARVAAMACATAGRRNADKCAGGRAARGSPWRQDAGSR